MFYDCVGRKVNLTLPGFMIIYSFSLLSLKEMKFKIFPQPLKVPWG